MSNYQIVIDVPLSDKDRVINGVAIQTGWTAQVQDEDGNTLDNPVSKEDHVNNYLIKHIRNLVIVCESKEAQTIKQKQSKSEVDAINLSVK